MSAIGTSRTPRMSARMSAIGGKAIGLCYTKVQIYQGAKDLLACRRAFIGSIRPCCLLGRPRHCTKEESMIKLIAVAFALALATSAQAMPLVPLQQLDESVIIQVREACGAGMRRTANGNCIRTPTRRAASRCARGV